MNQITPAEKEDFFDRFLKLYLSMGIGSLPKREIDLFIFHFLINSSVHRNKSNYELANEFGVPESRIKSMRLNAALRHVTINSSTILSHVISRLIHSEQYIYLTEGKIEVSLEDPLEKRELENYLKKRGHHAEYTFNSEVLKIAPIRLFELIMEHSNHANDEFQRLVQEHVQDGTVSARILADSPTLRQKLDKLRAENLNLNTLKALIGAGFTLLTGS